MEEKQIIPEAKIYANNSKKIGINTGAISSFPKMSFIDLETDQIKYPRHPNEAGAKFIKAREDIVGDLIAIKNHLNDYGIPFSCQSIDISLNNRNISDLERIGLEINLNSYAGLSDTMHPQYTDYVICPDKYDKTKLNLYAGINKHSILIKNKYEAAQDEYKVYDIRDTYLKDKPKIIKIFKNLLNITKIFEDYGFYRINPQKEFLFYSDNFKSNWFKFYKPSKIKIGYTYKELLSTVYENNGESIWQEADRKWDGKRFI